MKVLLIGHACGSGLGSEPGNTWEFATNLSKQHRVWLLAHPEYRDRVDASLAAEPNPNLQIIWITLDQRLDPWNPGSGEKGIRLHYLLWVSKAYKEAVRMHHDIQFDVVHHVSWGSVGSGPPFWKLPIPSIWGPLGGGQYTPTNFLRYFGVNQRKEKLRNLYVRSLKYSPFLQRTVRAASLILATNRETEQLLTGAGARDVRMFLDCGLPVTRSAETGSFHSDGKSCTFLWAGRLEHRKGLPLAIHALSRNQHLPIRLVVAGQGPLRAECEQMVKTLGVQTQVRFLGSVAYGDMPQVFRSSDALLFTSIRDSFGSVVLEAMSYGLPILTLNHQGVGSFVAENASIKVPVTTPEQVIGSLSEGMRKLYECTDCRRAMGAAALEQAHAETWDKRAKRMSDLYREVVSAHRYI
jgi:glycosyltransferase involved in cell wall biosynthesis